MFIKLIVSVFVLFAISRVWLRYRDGSIGVLGMVTWTTLWCGIATFAWWPRVTDFFAEKIGVGRGVDALVYISIIALFYGLFRIYVKMEYLEHEMTALVRTMALRQHDKER